MDRKILKLEKWCLELGFKLDEAKNFCQHFTQQSNPGMDHVWKHIIDHVRPKEEAQIIRKQYLMYLLRTGKHHQKIEVPVNSLKDYNSYMKIKKEEKTLKGIQEAINEKKKVIKEHLTKLEVSRQNSSIAEEELREKVYKLSQLKKKKLTMTKIIHKLRHDTKLLNILTKESNNIVGFNSATTDWEYQVLMTAKEIPHGIEFQSVLLKFNELHELKLNPVPYWDRTQLLTSMEKLLLSMIEKANSCRVALKENEALVEEKEKQVVSLISKRFDEVSEEEILELLKNFKNDLVEISEDNGRDLFTSKPYSLTVERYSISRLQRQIDSKLNEICSLLPVECEEITAEVMTNRPVIDLPPHIPFEKLINSLSNEISLFMKTSHWILKPNGVNYQNIEEGSTKKSQYLKLQRDMAKLVKILSLEENISNLIIPPAGVCSVHELKEKVTELCSKMNEYKQHCNESYENVRKTYKRLKAAFDFWRNEPLNERLTGVEIEGEDINFWLNSYLKLKEQIDHEEWLLNDSSNVC